jgi:DNA repair protein RecO (recombination protein O)
MSDRKILLQPAYVLHQRAYRDTSALLEFFTPEYGRLGVIAKGMKTRKSNWRGLLQPFQPLLISWNQHGELGTLTAAESQGPSLIVAPEFIASGFYLNEIIMRLVDRYEGQLELFGCYDDTLRNMANIDRSAEDKSVQLEIILRKFEVQLLAALGYGLVLDREAITGTTVQPGLEYVYQLEHGPVLVAANETESAISTGPRASGETLIAMKNSDFSDEKIRLQSKLLLRSVLGHYLGPKPLQSRDLAYSMNRIQ